ncbi:hypothetical protein [Limnoglobus roseus]|uniref:RNA polymerase sigma-70 region 4 domain-containing protein n=1 Tax=Limnoglobus roseus TaxID=2598579 RepID=A0A5C1AKM7_9BACT|nr:hypothetical protein [Limnoglobus roseus]QEL17714.1 hypothetical protein PX52LOC_04713 [Limnoglobus roseus]
MTAFDQRQRTFHQRIFAALVTAQDAGASVAESRQHVAERFGVTTERVREVEQEGIEKQWPPL